MQKTMFRVVIKNSFGESKMFLPEFKSETEAEDFWYRMTNGIDGMSYSVVKRPKVD